MARKLIVEIVGDSRSYERALGRSEKATKKFGGSTKQSAKHAAKLGAEFVAAAVAIGTVASREFDKFESAMNKIVGLVGVSRTQVEAWHEDLMTLSTEVAKSPEELADALFFVTSAGFRGQAALEALRVSAMASAAGLGETKVVADAVTSAVNSYGAANLSATQSADILTATVREGKTAADALAPVIGNIAPLAAELGVGFDQVGAAMAGMTRTGTSAMKAATGLRAVFATLLKPQKRSIEAFKAQGLNIDKLREMMGTKGGLIKVLTLVRKKFGDNTKELARAFPNTKALTTVLQLVGKNADEVRKIFKRMEDSTGSVGRAFKAISEDEGFQFGRTLQALRVIGIRVGAMLEPLANLIAKTLTAAFQKVSGFLKKFEEARTIRGKLNVVWEGVKGAGKRAQDLLTKAVTQIDWGKVWAGAADIGDELQKNLEKVNWAFLGEEIGEGIKKSLDVIIPAAKELTERINKAIRSVDFSGLGRKLGPELATAVVTGFLTLLDPAFWIRNWDLAIAVAATAFAGPLGKLGAKLVAPFARLGGQLVGRVTPFIVEAMNAIPRLMGLAILKGTQFVGAQLGRLGSFVASKFKALGGVARFAIKVLGITAAINVVVNFTKRVARFFRDLVTKTLPGIWNKFFGWLKKRFLEAMLTIIEPFTKIPRILGGGTFQDLKKEWKATLTTMEGDTETSTANIQGSIDRLEGRNIVVTVTQVSGPGGPGGLKPGGSTGKTKSGGKTGGTKTTGKEVETAAERTARLKKEEAAALARTKKAAEKAETAFEKLMDALSLNLDMAIARRGFKDDIAALLAIQKAIRDRIKVVGRTTELVRMLWETTQQLNQTQKDAAAAAQFQALGLTPEGEKKTPSSGSLLKRAQAMLKNIKGTVLDTKANRAQLRRIISVLKKNFKTAGKEVRQAILDMLNDISGAGDKTQAKGPLTKTKQLNSRKILAGLGLSPEDRRELQARLSHFTSAGKALAGSASNTGGTRTGARYPGRQDDRPIIVNTTVNIDGSKVARSTTRHQQRTKRRNPQQKRGQNRGI